MLKWGDTRKAVSSSGISTFGSSCLISIVGEVGIADMAVAEEEAAWLTRPSSLQWPLLPLTSNASLEWSDEETTGWIPITAGWDSSLSAVSFPRVASASAEVEALTSFRDGAMVLVWRI